MSRSSSPDGRLRVALLGSTGSIGRQAVEVLALHGDRFRVAGLAAGRQVDVLGEQVERLRPTLVALGDDAPARPLDLPAGCRRIGGATALEEIATHPDVDLVIVATGGFHVPHVPALAAALPSRSACGIASAMASRMSSASAFLRAAKGSMSAPRSP